MTVPSVPPLPAELLAAHGDAHSELTALLEASTAAVRRVFTRLGVRILVESLAHLRPTFVDVEHPLLVPAPRRFLTRDDHARRRGAEAAFRHVDSRLAMVGAGQRDRVIDHGTTEVLHALLQRDVQPDRESNPGIVRATPTNWHDVANPFQHPDARECRALLAAAVDLVHDAPIPPIAAAGWFAFTIMTVHPFVDGNGRTARICAVALASAGPHGLDWGVLEQWALDRDGYVRALQAGQTAERYEPSAVDPELFMIHVARTSIRGAKLAAERVRALATLIEVIVGRVEDDSVVGGAVQVLLDRRVEIATLQTGADPTALATDLVGAGLARWDHRRAGDDVGTAAFVLVPGPAVADLVGPVAQLRSGQVLTTGA